MSPWWTNAVIYQVYLRSFADSDGDGIGDLDGVRSRLPYLHDLGVDGIWLTPFYTSPMNDGGYDITDHRDVDPVFGTLADFDALLADAHALNLRIIIDLVPNHTSDTHPWFHSHDRRKRYIFRPGRDGGPPNDWESVFGGPAWSPAPDGDDWYLHLFDATQPDLDWHNPEVADEYADILRYWLDRGVDGVRIDVAHGLFKADGLPDVGYAGQDHRLDVLPFFDQDGVHDVYRRWRKILDSYPGDRIGVAEAWAPTADRLALYTRPDELHQAFNFPFLLAPWQAPAVRAVVDRSLAAGSSPTWVLSNHDVQRHRTRLGSAARAQAATLFMLALPGSAYLYQGEELGLPEVLDLPDEALQDPTFSRSDGADRGRDGCRIPLPWTAQAPAFGFSQTGRPWLPMPADWAELSVQAQQRRTDSTLALYRHALRLRRSFAGELAWHDAPEGVLVFSRSSLTCTTNFSDRDIAITAPGSPVLSSAPLPPIRDDGAVLIPKETCVWWQ
ncbi:glycoside hydrolase family 13 protein [Sphaerisporangium sp. NPDC051017]|uniref:glycoside hydrolase family 13 protein n=1 Tax=Sphaerisporangium sp. NPDC051017 TaxID=3154636 RepID=UPI003412D3C9